MRNGAGGAQSLQHTVDCSSLMDVVETKVGGGHLGHGLHRWRADMLTVPSAPLALLRGVCQYPPRLEA
jgi:hypothetical protein